MFAQGNNKGLGCCGGLASFVAWIWADFKMRHLVEFFSYLITNYFEYGPSLSKSYIGRREVFSISIVSPHCRIESTLSTLSVLLSIWPKHIDINSSADQSGTLALSWVKLQASRCLKSSFAPNIDMIIQWL